MRRVTRGAVLIDYTYDATGNRVSKKVANGSTVVLTTYVRDAAGNVLATYIDNSALTTADVEYSLYGSSRIGRVLQSSILKSMLAIVQPANKVYLYKPGIYQYELSNHLGNVHAVITGLKLGESTDGNAVNAELYRCTVVSLSDYYPFGMEIEGRTFVDANAYRFGFNGKEKDPEGMGGGGSTYDYGFRIYNAQIGKFLSVDPLTKEYPWYTPYQFAGNKPIHCIDLDGLEEIIYHVNKFKQLNGSTEIVIHQIEKTDQQPKVTSQILVTGGSMYTPATMCIEYTAEVETQVITHNPYTGEVAIKEDGSLDIEIQKIKHTWTESYYPGKGFVLPNIIVAGDGVIDDDNNLPKSRAGGKMIVIELEDIEAFKSSASKAGKSSPLKSVKVTNGAGKVVKRTLKGPNVTKEMDPTKKTGPKNEDALKNAAGNAASGSKNENDKSTETKDSIEIQYQIIVGGDTIDKTHKVPAE